jgi:hypothetical protein
VTHTFEIGDAAAAYRMIEAGTDPYLAVQIKYSEAPDPGPILVREPVVASSSPGIGWLGAGAFSTGTLLPAFRAAGFENFVVITSASGLSARRAAERHGFARVVSGAFPVIDDPSVEVVVIATPHDSHAELAIVALKDGRHVWCEKPLAVTSDQLDEVERAWRGSGLQLAVGFNRRWSPAVQSAQLALAEIAGPKLLVYRIAAGRVPDGHWYHDRRQGGRVLGEVCHFVDTAQALIGATIEDVAGLPGSGDIGSDEAIVALRFADGQHRLQQRGTECWQGVDRGTGRDTPAGHRGLPERHARRAHAVEGQAGQGPPSSGKGVQRCSVRSGSNADRSRNSNDARDNTGRLVAAVIHH